MKKSSVIGITMIGIGILLMVQNTIGLSVDIWSIIWPLFLLIPGIVIHANYFRGNRRESWSILLGGILLVYGAFFLLKAIIKWPDSYNMDFVYTLGIGVGFLESYLFNKKSSMNLILSIIFIAVSVYTFIKSAFPDISNINGYIFPILLVVLGVYLLFTNLSKKKNY
ncbi:MAG TPA: hypothetical protein DEF85_06420 [Clostridiaceae bacterium]|jgi:uncharacterized membrane protein YhaH (DUF805 family)|nr:hypothetical protein [Clostridiaceae bacterium]HBF77722.1 hypothetical protein [Clostridiaceae bacterium]HBG39270.1 hypothetical protein [Clostridiaceae bacterium]HBN29595.1 hypothetical protein [Clostridiaceae bacterium]HBX48507.1 hypothetical protein [Clostridiaceae bacterium]